MGAPGNPHERAARARKVTRLVAALEAAAAQTGWDLTSVATYRMLARASCRMLDATSWTSLAAACEVGPPSEQTQRMVYEALCAKGIAVAALARGSL